MPPGGRRDPGPARTIVVVLDGATVPGVTGVAGLGLEREVVEFRDGGDPGVTRRLPGRRLGGDLRITRPLTTDPTFESWVRGPGPGGAVVATRDLRVRFMDRRGDPVRRYRLLGAWARGLEVAGSTTFGSAGPLEILTVAYDDCVPE